MHYLIEQTLKETPKKEIAKGKKRYVAVFDSNEWKKEKENYPFYSDLDNELLETNTTKATVNYESLSGTFSIPNRSNMEKDDFCFAYALDKKGIVFVDDSGYVKNAIDAIIKTKKWNTPSLERFIYDFFGLYSQG